MVLNFLLMNNLDFTQQKYDASDCINFKMWSKWKNLNLKWKKEELKWRNNYFISKNGICAFLCADIVIRSSNFRSVSGFPDVPLMM